MQAALNGPSGQITLGSDSVTIGRSADNSIALNDAQASSRHAEIRPQGEGYVITDLGSSNGTFINSQRLTPNVPHVLQPNDFIRIGSTEYRFESYGTDGHQQQDAAVGPGPNAWDASNYAPTVGIPPAAPFPNNPDAAAYPPPANYPQQGFQQPPGNYPQPGYPPPSPDYPNYGVPPQQPYAPPVQPGQYNQYGQSGTTAPGRPVQSARRSHRGLWIGLIVLLLLVVIVAVGAFLYVNRSTPTKTLQAYCDALSTNNAQEAYNQLSSSTQAQVSLNRFTTSFNQGERLLNSPLVGGIKSCTVGNVQENGSSATGTIVIAVNNINRTISVPEKLTNENGTWKINNGNKLPTT